MSFPKVEITIANGALGGVAQTGDGIVGLVLGLPVKPSGMTLGTAKQYTRLSSVEADGLDAAYDTANSCNAYRQVKELYDLNPDAVVWIMPVINTATMTEICDKAEDPAYLLDLIKQSKYAVKVVGICRTPDGGYVPTYAHGLDDDAYHALAKAQSLSADLIAQGTPVIIIIEGRAYQGDAGDLEDLKAGANNHCAIVICGTSSTDKSASVGYVMGELSILPVQRNIGRVKNGALPINDAYLSDGTTVVLHPDLESIHNKGYITIRKYLNRSGFYFSDDPMATADTDDFCTISRRRVINKAVRIAQDTYTEEINEEIDIASDGTIAPATCKYIQSQISRALKTSMLAEGNISDLSVVVDPAQNVLSTNKIVVRLRLLPKGQSKIIEVDLGFTTATE